MVMVYVRVAVSVMDRWLVRVGTRVIVGQRYV